MLITEDTTVKCRTVQKVLFLYFNLCLSVKLNSLSQVHLHLYHLLLIKHGEIKLYYYKHALLDFNSNSPEKQMFMGRHVLHSETLSGL